MIKTLRKFISIELLISVLFLCYGCNNKINKVVNKEYDWFIEYLGLPELWKSTTGDKITVAVIDSGIDYNLLGKNFDKTRIVAVYNAIDDSDNVTDSTLHGTAMVNIIGANGGNGFYGVAPKCDFVIIKALNTYGATNSVILEKAIKFAVNCGVDIINLSIGGEAENEKIIEAVTTAMNANIAVICSVGDYERENAIFPACLNECIGVAAIDSDGMIYKKSNYGNGVDVYFPGVKIKTGRYDYRGNIVYIEKSGSSLATAVASGVVALYMEYL